jgi:hypothetical protein
MQVRESLVLTCPRISPAWQLAAQLALVKPKPYTKDKIAHATAIQPWPRTARRTIIEVLGGAHRPLFPGGGAHRMVLPLSELEPAAARRIARKLSKALPELWFSLDRFTYIRGGVFYQRTGRYNLELVRANRMRLRRAVRFGFLGDVDHAVTSAHYRNGQNQRAKSDR